MAEFPAMPLWTDAYLADTRHLNATEHGAYLLLLITHWRIGEQGLPDDEKLLARYACVTMDKWRKMAPTIRAFFDISGGRMTQARVLDELLHARGRRERSSAGGNAKALKTNRTHRAKRAPNSCQNSAHPEPEPNLIEKEEPSGSSKKRIGTRLPDDWQPSGPDFEFAVKAGFQGGDLQGIADEFRDYWHAQPGQRGVKLDWAATWRNWIRREGRRPKPQKRYVSKSGFEYRGTRDEVKRHAKRRADHDTVWGIEIEERQEREAQGVGKLVSGVMERLQ